MAIWLTTLAALVGYLTAFFIQCHTLRSSHRLSPLWYGLALIGCLSQGLLLYYRIDTPHGQDLSSRHIVALIIWLSILLTLVTALKKPVHNLALLLFPLAAVSLAYGAAVPNLMPLIVKTTPSACIHIWLATLSLSMLCIATMQAFFATTQNHLLKSPNPNAFLRWLPPLLSMEALLFQILRLSFFLLTLLLFSTFYFFKQQLTLIALAQVMPSLIAWLLLFILLIGNSYRRWRSRTVMGFVLLALMSLLITHTHLS